MFGGGNVSLADIAAVTDRNNNGGFGDMGGMGGWWVLIILLALFGGFGNGGWGNGRGGNSCDSGTTIVTVPTPGYGGMGMGFGFEGASMQRGFDNSQVIAKLDGINSGICSLGYDQLAQMNGINTNIMQQGFGLQQAINNNTVAGMQNTNAIMTQQSDCCCKTQSSIKDLAFDMATLGCGIKTEVHQTGDAIIQSQNWGFRNIQDAIQQGFANMERQADQRYIRELEAKLNSCDRDSALDRVATRIVSQVRPTAGPAWVVPNPYAGNNGCCSYNTGCGNCA